MYCSAFWIRLKLVQLAPLLQERAANIAAYGRILCSIAGILVAFLLLVAIPFVPSSFLLVVWLVKLSSF